MLGNEDTSTLESTNWCTKGYICVEGHISHIFKRLRGQFFQFELLLLLLFYPFQPLFDGCLLLLAASRPNLVPRIHLDGVIHELLLHRLGSEVILEKLREVDEPIILDPVLVFVRFLIDIHGSPDRLFVPLLQKRWSKVPGVFIVQILFRVLSGNGVLLLLLLGSWLDKILGRLIEDLHLGRSCLLLGLLLDTLVELASREIVHARSLHDELLEG